MLFSMQGNSSIKKTLKTPNRLISLNLSESAIYQFDFEVVKSIQPMDCFAERFWNVKIDDETPSGLSNLLIYLKKQDYKLLVCL